MVLPIRGPGKFCCIGDQRVWMLGISYSDQELIKLQVVNFIPELKSRYTENKGMLKSFLVFPIYHNANRLE